MPNFIVPESDDNELMSLHDYVTSQPGRTAPAILTHLTERGLVSGEPYMMSNVNHRDLNTVYWHEQVDPSQPFTMIQSLTKPNHSRRFDVGNNYMTLYFYEVTDQVNSITEEGTSLRTTRFVAKGKGASVYSVGSNTEDICERIAHLSLVQQTATAVARICFITVYY